MLNNAVALLTGGVAASTSSFESIASATGNGSSGTITFSSIPSTYTSLQIRAHCKDTYNPGSSGNDIILMRFNSDASSANYTYHILQGNGTSAAAYGDGTGSYAGAYISASAYGTTAHAGSVIDIHDYASTSRYKTVRALSGADFNGSGGIYLNSSLWLSTSAINSITLVAGSTAFATTTTFALYGIKGA